MKYLFGMLTGTMVLIAIDHNQLELLSSAVITFLATIDFIITDAIKNK